MMSGREGVSMKDTFNELFKGKLDVEKVCNDSAMIGDEDYLFCEIDGLLCHGDGKAPERAKYIANATNNFADMYEMLEGACNELYKLINEVNKQKLSSVNSQTETPPDLHDMETCYSIHQLLKRTRGE